MNTETATETLLSFWKEPSNIPFKGSLISEEPPNDGDEPITCMCAQGQALHIVGGYSEEDLRKITQGKADKEVAKLLGISVAHSILLREINDNQEGAPSDVLTNPEKYLGENYQAVLNFWRSMDSLTEDNWKDVSYRFRSLDYAERDSALYAALIASGLPQMPYVCVETAAEAAQDAAALCAGGSGAWDAVRYATYELIGNVQNPVSVPLFDNLGS